MKFLIIIPLLFLFTSTFHSLSMDTNKIQLIKELTNLLGNTNSLNLSIGVSTNINLNPILEPELPNSYLSTGIIEWPKPESEIRRFDVVAFITIPVSFYLLLNLMNWKNQLFYPSVGVLDNADWNYIYFDTFIVPIAVAYFDSLYVEKQQKIKEKMLLSKNDNGIQFGINFYTYRF